MRILLDTHCWLWMNAHSRRLSAAGRRRIASLENELFLSAASVWEIAIKYSLGRLPLPESPSEYIPYRLTATRTVPLSVTYTHALKAGELPRHHPDPFDRVLIAQAQVENLVIMTADEQFEAYDVQIVSP